MSNNVVCRADSPQLHASDELPAFITFSHFSPYVICGDPADDANPMTAAATDGLRIVGKAAGTVELSISADQGQTWHPVGELQGGFERDVTDLVKGRYGWQARFRWKGRDGIDELQFTTVTQVCQAIYPRLKADGTTVTYRAASQTVVPVLPHWGLPDEETARHEEKRFRSANVVYAQRSPASRYGYRTTDNKPGVVVFRIDSPTQLTEVTAAVRFGVRVPPAECDFHLDLSLDGGQSWQPLARAEIPPDNEYSSGWMYGKKPIGAAGVKQALVRAHFFNGGYEAGLIDAQIYGLRRTARPEAAEITYGWKEGGERRQFRQRLAAGTHEQSWNVPTGPSIVDDFVRIAVAE
jgi:hypothetical protein